MRLCARNSLYTALYGFLLELGKATMTTKGREVGERIKVRISTPFVHAGTLGTILRVDRCVADAYDIRFDRDTHHWVMQGCDLERRDAPPRLHPWAARLYAAINRGALRRARISQRQGPQGAGTAPALPVSRVAQQRCCAEEPTMDPMKIPSLHDLSIARAAQPRARPVPGLLRAPHLHV